MKLLAISLFISLFVGNVIAETVDAFRTSSKESHEIVLLNHGLASLEERLEMIENAKESIDVEYFIYNLDKSGRIFTQALIDKARQGVKVRMLLDYFMVKKQFSPFYAHEMEQAGVQVKYFNVTSTLNLISGQYRNHRKILLVDGKSVITGGRNIGDEYFDLREDFNFLDRDLKVTGPIVASIQETFNQIWDSKYSMKIVRENKPNPNNFIYHQGKNGDFDQFRYDYDLKRWNKNINEASSFINSKQEFINDDIRMHAKSLLEKEYRGTCDNMTYYSEYPIVGKKNRDQRIIIHDISNRIANANESVLFDSPYFIDNEESKMALESALAKNTKVTLLTNSLNSTDAIYVYAVFDNIIKNWISKGLETYIFKGELPNSYQEGTERLSKARFGIHAKSFVFDNKDVVIGTFNFDPRSATYNTEMIISCDNNPELANEVANDIKERINYSFHLDSSKSVDDYEFYNVGFFKRLKYYFLILPSNVLDYLL